MKPSAQRHPNSVCSYPGGIAAGISPRRKQVNGEELFESSDFWNKGLSRNCTESASKSHRSSHNGRSMVAMVPLSVFPDGHLDRQRRAGAPLAVFFRAFMARGVLSPANIGCAARNVASAVRHSQASRLEPTALHLPRMHFLESCQRGSRTPRLDHCVLARGLHHALQVHGWQWT